jgi:hypothetical protein
MADDKPTTPGEPASSPQPAAPLETPGRDEHSKVRSITAVICVVLAALLTTPAAVAYWGQRTLNDTERYVDTVGPLVDSPEVQDVLATTVTDAIQKQVNIEAILNDVFAGVITDRPRLEQLVGPLSAAINGLIDREVRAFIASDEFADIWTRISTRVQQTAEQLLNGDESGAVSLQNDEVVLDVGEVIAQVKQRLADRGLTFVENAPIPATDQQIVLLEAPQVKQIRDIYAFTNPVARWLLPLVGLLYLLAFILARRRPRMTVAIGAVLAANALLVALALSIGRQLFVNELSGTVFGPASTVFYDTLLTYLQRGQQVFLAFGLILVVAGWFAGSNKYGTTVRTTVSSGLEELGTQLAGTGHISGVGRWVRPNAGWLRVVVVALGAVVLLWGNEVTLTRLWWSLAVVLLLLATVQILFGAGRPARETQPAPPPGAATSEPL